MFERFKSKPKDEGPEDPGRRAFLKKVPQALAGAAAVAAVNSPIGKMTEAIAGPPVTEGGAILAPLTNPEHPHEMEKSILVAQKILSDPGNFGGKVYYRGPINGKWSKELSAAIAAYQDPLSEWYNDDITPDRKGILDERTMRNLSSNFYNSPKMDPALQKKRR